MPLLQVHCSASNGSALTRMQSENGIALMELRHWHMYESAAAVSTTARQMGCSAQCSADWLSTPLAVDECCQTKDASEFLVGVLLAILLVISAAVSGCAGRTVRQSFRHGQGHLAVQQLSNLVQSYIGESSISTLAAGASAETRAKHRVLHLVAS